MIPSPVAPFRLALAQMLVEGGRPAENLRRAEQRIAEAAAGGAQVVVLPEALSLGWTHPSAALGAEPIPDGPSCRRLRRAARQAGVYVAAGLVEAVDGRIFNSAVLIDPDGGVLLRHRKIHELDIALGLYSCGSADCLSVTPTPFGVLGLMVCADAFAPGEWITRRLAALGAQVLLSPCAWAVPPGYDQAREPYGRLWKECYGAPARDCRLWIAGASSVGPISAGPWAGWACIGCSLVVGPDGAPVRMAPYGPAADTLLYVDVPCACAGDPRGQA